MPELLGFAVYANQVQQLRRYLVLSSQDGADKVGQ